jgi:DNA-binding XRE family transcriptional regulator
MKGTHEPLYQIIGDRIKMHRERMMPLLSQEKLAKRIDLTRASIVNIEAGRQKAPVHVLWDICEVLGVELSAIIPRAADLANASEPMHLTEEQVNKIEAAASGDPRTRRLLTEFVSRALTSTDPTTPS